MNWQELVLRLCKLLRALAAASLIWGAFFSAHVAIEAWPDDQQVISEGFGLSAGLSPSEAFAQAKRALIERAIVESAVFAVWGAFAAGALVVVAWVVSGLALPKR